MQHTTKQMIKPALFEATFVVLGVLLALAANEWRNTVAEQKTTERALQSIYAEIAENRALVEESNSYHMHTLRALNSQRESPNITLFNKGFILPARVSSSAWLTAIETGALKNASFDIVLSLSTLYASQNRYETQSLEISKIIYEKLFEGGSVEILNNHQNLAMIISTMQFREHELIKLYETALVEN